MKPELLLPVGNTESFYAALEGGADAVYLGLRSFNARGRAKIFVPNQLQSLLEESQKSGLKGYLTLNTLINLSYIQPSQNTFNRLLKKLNTSTAEQPGTSFNFKVGLK